MILGIIETALIILFSMHSNKNIDELQLYFLANIMLRMELGWINNEMFEMDKSKRDDYKEAMQGYCWLTSQQYQSYESFHIIAA